MTNKFLSNNFHKLSDIQYRIHQESLDFSAVLISRLNTRTLTSIRNSFSKGVLIWENGVCYIKVSLLSHLLRTGNSGAHNYYWQRGIEGYVSPSSPYTIDGEIYISGPDFCGLLEARISSTYGNTNIYLKYVRAIYQSINSHHTLLDLRLSFIDNVERGRNQLKSQRIQHYNITCCEFTGQVFLNSSQVEFAHIDSVSTSPFQALNINNGVIILKEIHSQLTREGIHDFAGMYDYCNRNGYNTDWAEYYDL